MKKLVIIPGGFHPFHAGHMALYSSVVEKYPNADVYVAATDDKSTRPFPFELKRKLASVAGVPPHRFIQVKSPFVANEIKQMYDADSTVLVFVRSEKDMTSQPQPGQVKKDGSAGYLQPYKMRNRVPMSQHAYMDYMPTVQFGGMTSATEIRNKWPNMDAKEKANLISILYPATTTKPGSADKIIEIFDTVLGANKVEEAKLVPTEDGVDIVVDGLGTYDEDTLVMGVKRGIEGILKMLEARNYKQLQYVIHNSSWAARVDALAEYERFMDKQGNRPLAKDKVYNMDEETIITIRESGESVEEYLKAREQLVELHVTQRDALRVLYNLAARKDNKPFPIRMYNKDVIGNPEAPGAGVGKIEVTPDQARLITKFYDTGDTKRQQHIERMLKTYGGWEELISMVETVQESWSKKYKDSIDCSNPKGFSQKAHCAGRKKKD